MAEVWPLTKLSIYTIKMLKFTSTSLNQLKLAQTNLKNMNQVMTDKKYLNQLWIDLTSKKDHELIIDQPRPQIFTLISTSNHHHSPSPSHHSNDNFYYLLGFVIISLALTRRSLPVNFFVSLITRWTKFEWEIFSAAPRGALSDWQKEEVREMVI
jgi:hypothetical protein